MNIENRKIEKLDGDLREFFAERRDVPPQVKSNVHFALLAKQAELAKAEQLQNSQQNSENTQHPKIETWLYLVGFAAAISMIFSAIIVAVIGILGFWGMLPFGGFPAIMLGIGYYFMVTSSAASSLLCSQKLKKRAI
ncbi:MAG: hypothetical protein FWG64_04580 [Firmicutes bacterium]|nr:hypothetical protein [Bacillota bacterium]